MSIFSDEAIAFCILYVITAVLLVYTFKTKKTDTLPQALIYAFACSGFIALLNLILKVYSPVPTSAAPFYQMNFLVFVGPMLVANLYLHKRKSRAAKK